MRLQVDYSKQVDCPISRAFVIRILEETLEASGYDFLREKTVSVNVAFVSPEEIQKLNNTYRQKNKVTDVLSFPEYNGKNDIINEASENIFLGEIVLCYDYVVQASKEDKVSLEQELSYILSHGLLHLLGFDHSEEMFAMQDQVSEKYR